MKITLLLLFYLFAPALLIYFTEKISLLKKIGVVVLAYAAGLILGTFGLIPEGAESLQDWIANITIPLALPLLLFNLNVKSWLSMAGKTFVSFILALVALVTVVLTGYFLFRANLSVPGQIAGLLIGVYTGGTANLAAITVALNLDKNIFMMVNLYDIMLSAVYILFLMTLAQRLFTKLLPAFKPTETYNKKSIYPRESSFNDFRNLIRRANQKPIFAGLGISALIFAIAGGAGQLVPEKMMMAVVILLITTLGLLASLNPKIHRLKGSFDAGMYLILIFSIDAASMADIQKFSSISPHLFYYVSFAIIGTILVHFLLARLFKVDADTVIITSVAMITSPPFVPMVAASINNREIIISGLTVGIVGYAIGNYLGVTLSLLLGG